MAPVSGYIEAIPEGIIIIEAGKPQLDVDVIQLVNNVMNRQQCPVFQFPYSPGRRPIHG